jgi:hypothetical protein
VPASPAASDKAPTVFSLALREAGPGLQEQLAKQAASRHKGHPSPSLVRLQIRALVNGPQQAHGQAARAYAHGQQGGGLRVLPVPCGRHEELLVLEGRGRGRRACACRAA